MAHQAVVVAVLQHQRALLRRNWNHGGLGTLIRLLHLLPRQAASVLHDVCGRQLLQQGTSPYFQYYGTSSEKYRLLRGSIALG